MANTKPIHERVAEHVASAGLSNARISKLTGWSEQRVWRMLTGRTAISAEDMETFSRILAKPVAVLYRPSEKTA